MYNTSLYWSLVTNVARNNSVYVGSLGHNREFYFKDLVLYIK